MQEPSFYLTFSYRFNNFMNQILFLPIHRFCVCMLHEQFTRWLCTLHKIILAHHDDNCECVCGFCVSCGDLEALSISTFMRLMLCPPSMRFHGSSIPLYDWNCIDDK